MSVSFYVSWNIFFTFKAVTKCGITSPLTETLSVCLCAQIVKLSRWLICSLIWFQTWWTGPTGGGLKINLRLPEIWQKKKKFNYIALIKYHCPKNIEILKWQSKLILSPQDEGEFQLKVQLSSVWHRKKKHFCSTKYWYLFVLYWIIFTSLQMICSRSEKGNWFGWTVHTYWIESRNCFRIRSHEPDIAQKKCICLNLNQVK